MIDRYLEGGELFVLKDNDVKVVCVVTDEKDGVLLKDMIYLKQNIK